MKLLLTLTLSLSCVAQAALPECAEAFNCLAIAQPVCGSNGVTYMNVCELRKAQCQDKTVTKRGDGACTAEDKPTTTAPPTAPSPGTPGTTTKAPTTPDATTAAPTAPGATTKPPGSSETAKPAPSSAGSSGGQGVGSASKDKETSPSVGGTSAAPSATTKAPVPSSTPKSEAAPLYVAGLSALAATILAAVL